MIRYRLQLRSRSSAHNGKNGKEIQPAVEGLRGLQPAICMAQKMGEGLGQCTLLLGQMSQGALIWENGAGYKVRTRDPLITNQVLYQLS